MRSFWSNLLLGFAIRFIGNCAIAWGVAYYTASSGDRLLAFAVVLAAFYAIPIVLWIKDAILNGLTSFLVQRRTKEAMLLELQRGKFPTGLEFDYLDADEYFSQVVASEQASSALRLKASQTLSSLNYYRGASWAYAMIHNATLNAALREYFILNPIADDD